MYKIRKTERPNSLIQIQTALPRIYSHKHEDRYNEDGKCQLQCKEAKDLADETPSDRGLLEVANILVGVILR